VIAPRGVIVRASSDVLAFHDSDLREAVRLIRERGGKGLSGPKLAQTLSISPRSLQRKFQRELRCRPQDQIRQARLAKVRSLLTETDLPMRDVARQAGYTNLPQLCAVFKGEFGITLSEYRRRSHRAAHPQPTPAKLD
jgi:LacI family transcriptional regulator